MDPVISEFMRKTPVLLLDKHRRHTRQVAYVVQQCTAKAFLAAAVFERKRTSNFWSEESVFVTGSVVEGASLARMFSPDHNTAKEFEIDLMMTFFDVKADESLIRYVDNNAVFAHVIADSSVVAHMSSLFTEDVQDGVFLCYEDDLYLNTSYLKKRFQRTGSQIFEGNPLYRFSMTDENSASRSASIASWVDDLNDGEDTNSTAKLFQLAVQLKPCCERFEDTFAEMMERVLLLQKELAAMRFGDVSLSLHYKAAKALEWAKTCMAVSDLIFDCRQQTLCVFVNRSIGVDLSTINDGPRDYMKGRLEGYIDRLTVTEDDLSDPSVAASVCQTLDEIDDVSSKQFLGTFQQLASDVTLFSSLIRFGERNPQLCRIPPSLEQQSAIIKRYSIDYVPCVQLMFWPSVAADWQTRVRLWPDQSVVDAIVSKGAHLIGKEFCHEHIDWRLSFSVAEIDLATRWVPVQHFVYFVFKALFYKFIKPLSAGSTSDDSPHAPGKKFLTSYLAKTVMMWTSESFDESWWTEDNAAECLLVLLLALQSAFEARTLSHYFVSSVNLLEGLPELLAKSVIDRINYIVNDPTEVAHQLTSHFEKTDIFLNAISEEAKSAGDISLLLNTVSSLSDILSNIDEH